MREIVVGQVKFLAQVSIHSLKRGGQLGFNSFAGGGFFQFRKVRDRRAELNPNRRSPKWEPTSFRVEPIGSENHTGNNRNAGDVSQGRCAGAKRCASQKRPCAVSNSAFRKNADDSAM